MSGDERITDQATIRASWEDDAAPLVKKVKAALDSGRDAAVVQVVLDETDQLRADRDTYRDAWESAEAKVAQLEDTLTLRSEALNRTGADNDQLRAKVARVEKLLVHLHTDLVYAGDVRAALRGES